MVVFCSCQPFSQTAGHSVCLKVLLFKSRILWIRGVHDFPNTFQISCTWRSFKVPNAAFPEHICVSLPWTQAYSHGLPSNVPSFCSVSRVVHLALLWLVLKISSVEGAKDWRTTQSRSPKTLNGIPQATLRNISQVFCFWQQFGEEKSRAVLILEIQYMT